uniref:16S rRNA (uracil(1498)-N(3))-methyltransferase n=1 Tax=Paulinella chromatophora TaxID=39717 RepID=B1X5M7_PAUCH|nr:hypothetical protein PCC_0836 [Paulinella chromatophora]ACB43246.1 hypothetical protein PCC_0836 [Paulinella chromatophora]
MKELRRLFISHHRLGYSNEFKLRASESHYLTKVLRYRIGDCFAVIDGVGRLWSAILMDRERAQLEQKITIPLVSTMAPSPQLELAIALPRRGFDDLLQITSELGIDRIQPLIVKHCVTNKDISLDRCKAILQESTEQCERLWTPFCGDPCLFYNWIEQKDSDAAKNETRVKLFATTRRGGLISLVKLLNQNSSKISLSQSLSLAIGPEGGWTLNEEQRAEAAGWQAVSLGPRILKTRTAAIVAGAIMSNWRFMINLC